MYLVILDVRSRLWALGSFPRPWAGVSIMPVLGKEVVAWDSTCYLCSFSVNLTHNLLYQICGLVVFEKQNWLDCKSLASLLTLRSIPHIWCYSTKLSQPKDYLKFSPLWKCFWSVYSTPETLIFMKFFWQAQWKGFIRFSASLCSCRWALNSK